MANPPSRFPSPEEISTELKRIRDKKHYKRVLKSTVAALLSLIASVVLISALVLPVFRIYGDTMQPTLQSEQLIVTLRNPKVEAGDVIAFYYNNKILVKRVIAVGGDTVDIDGHGTVTVNDQKLTEPYLQNPAYGDCNISLPYQVPESKVFVMGDNRETSVDSRHTEVGCIAQEQIIGKVLFRIWPFDAIDMIA